MAGMRAGALMIAMLLLAVGFVPAASVEELNQNAVELLQAGKQVEARALLLKALESAPENTTVLYNLACCESLLGNLEYSRTRLVEAWEAGFRDIEMAKNDPDLEKLRESRLGKKLFRQFDEGLEEELRRFGRPLLFEAPMMATSRIVPPPKVEPGSKYQLVVVLHGHGATADFIVGMFGAAGLKPPFFTVAPYGPYAIPQGDRIGYSWYPPVWLYREVIRGFEGPKRKQDSVAELNRWEERVSEQYVLAAVERALQELPVDRGHVVLIGHSQGGSLAYRLALRHPDLFSGLVTVGCTLRQQDREAEVLKKAAGKLKVMVCHSPDDEAVSIENGKDAYRVLREAEIDAVFTRYSGGHGLSTDLIRTIAGWTEKAVSSDE